MNHLPLPTNLPWELQFLFWTLCGGILLLFGACLWWLMRFVKAHDDFKVDVKKTIVDQGDKFDKVSEKITETASNLEKSAVKFQGDIQTQLMAVHRRVVEIEGSVDKVVNKIDGVTGKVDLFDKRLDTISKTTDHNTEALKKSADILTKHNQMLTSHGGALKTLITKLGHDSVLVSQKKSDSDSDDKT